MNVEQDEVEDLIDKITVRLKDAGWTRDEDAEEGEWPEFEFDNGMAVVEFLYPPGEDWVRIGLVAEENEGYLKVPIEGKLDALLDVVTAAQGKLSADHWEVFIDDLLAVPLRVFALTGEDGDDVVELSARE